MGERLLMLQGFQEVTTARGIGNCTSLKFWFWFLWALCTVWGPLVLFGKNLQCVGGILHYLVERCSGLWDFWYVMGEFCACLVEP